MKRLLFICACVGFIFQSITVLAQNSSTGPAIDSIVVIADEDASEKVIIKLNTSHSPKSFRLDGERPRLIFDFLDVRYIFNKTTIEGAGGNIVAGVRAGRHRDPIKTRVVIDIAPGIQYEYEQTFNVSNNSLEISFSPGSSDKQSGSGQRQIHVAKPKLVHDTAPVEDKQDVSQEKTEPVKKEEEQPPVSQPEESQSITVLPADVKKQKVGADDASAVPEVSEDMPEKEDGEMSAEADERDISDSDEMSQTDPGHPVILDVSFEKSINSSETVLFKLSHFYPPLVFGIEKGEPRVVCDFHDAEIGADVPSEIAAGGKYVNRITVTNQTDPDKVRVELQLVPNHHYDLQQLFFKEDNLFVVIVNELEESPPAN